MVNCRFLLTQQEASKDKTWRGDPVSGAGGVVPGGDGWRMLHLLAYLAEMAVQTSTSPSCGL